MKNNELNKDRHWIDKEMRYSGEIPEICPCCQRSIFPDVIATHKDSDKQVSIIYQCNGCKDSFISKYEIVDQYTNQIYVTCYELEYKDSYPKNPQIVKFSSIIHGISKQFATIYNQALVAQQLGLNEICGIGYRKALEFLIKDYAIFNHHESSEEIKKLPLYRCTNKFIDDNSLKRTLVASIYLGNDETHYDRVFDNYSANDLVELIDAVVAQIEGIEKSKKIIASSNNPNF